MKKRNHYLCGAAMTALLFCSSTVDAKRMAPPVPIPGATSVAGITRFSLPNGLDVILAPDPTVTSVLVHVWYHVGSKDEVTGKTGFAHLFEHLMFKGSRDVKDGLFDLLLESVGGWNNGTTNTDRTNYFEQLPANQLELALYLESNRMAGLWDAMTQSGLDNQRDVVKNERRQSYENRPYGVAEFAVQQSLWPVGHGNYNLTIGTMADLSAASLADVEAFWRTYYRPSNATLVIVGQVDLGRTYELINRYFGWMPKQDKPKTRELDAPVTPLAAPVSLTATDNVTAPKVSMSFRADAPYTANATNLQVIAQLLGGSKTSRLNKRLVKKDRLATEAVAGYGAQVLGGEFMVYAIARDGVVADSLRKALLQELSDIRTNLVTADELARAVTTLEVDLRRAQENLASRAENIATWAATAKDPNFADKQIALWKAVTPQTILNTAKTWLADSASVTMTVTAKASTK
jgi:zinc protease